MYVCCVECVFVCAEYIPQALAECARMYVRCVLCVRACCIQGRIPQALVSVHICMCAVFRTGKVCTYVCVLCFVCARALYTAGSRRHWHSVVTLDPKP